jgi:hypothetical protein
MLKDFLNQFVKVFFSTLFFCNSLLYASNFITTDDLAGTTTASNPLSTNIRVTPTPSIRFEVGGARFSTVSSQLMVTIGVDTLAPRVTSGTAANQMFRDDTVGAAYFGYYLSTGVKSASQPISTIHIKIRRGTAETSDRSYYLLGNGLTTPTSQGNLTPVPAAFTTFAIAGSNASHCGPQYMNNGLIGGSINCATGTTIPNMDLTQFVKVLDSDGSNSTIISQVEFVAVNE